ncbi:hypothetical protein VTN77DRAFT_4221 [Rasamsonia byssochlamydoides]|uniref:uncharacterized protein n=1 Tax=Rasamsonia byssochlamydoides TaxID=89139 RepID=UPI0037447777
MAHLQNRERNRVPALHNFFKMLLSSNTSNLPAGQETDIVEDVDEPPDSHLLSPDTVAIPHPRGEDGQFYFKSPPSMPERKESLLTRALLNSPDLIPADRDHHRSQHSPPSYPHSNASGHSTAELTSDGETTSPISSNAPSPPLPSQLGGVHPPILQRKLTPPADPSESNVEANLGRKRCISFACGRRVDDTNQQKGTDESPKRKTTLTFACPARQPEIKSPPNGIRRRASSRSRPRGSPAPPALRSPPAEDVASQIRNANEPQPSQPPKKPGSIHISGLGGFRPSEETRFHEFASSVEEEDEWVARPTDFKDKITLNDCMKKENAIRKLGEEAEAEAMAEEEEEDYDEADPDEEAGEEDDSTVHDFSSDDGNESDNEAGFADSDDESDDSSDYRFWAPSTPSTTTAATSAENISLAAERRNSNSSIESLNQAQSWLPAPARREKGRRAVKVPRPATPDLPDSTDFVCGTLDEDRPLEAAYISCMEERRRLKHVPVPQDIDPSFPTTDPEDNDDLDEEDDEDLERPARTEDELLRSRPKGSSRRTSPRMSPKRPLSPAPRVLHGHHSPKRMKSPAPKFRSGSNAGLPVVKGPTQPAGVNITGPVQRPNCSRTKSLPRTPNPFFIDLEKERQSSIAPSLAGSPERGVSRTREMHTRGPIDIIQGLERKRQKRKEKFWRQHCRKAAKEHAERRPVPGKGAERMKELGLEVAERFKAYGVGQDAQLVLSV